MMHPDEINEFEQVKAEQARDAIDTQWMAGPADVEVFGVDPWAGEGS